MSLFSCSSYRYTPNLHNTFHTSKLYLQISHSKRTLVGKYFNHNLNHFKMSKIIQLTVYASDAAIYASASPQAYNADTIINLENASPTQVRSVPSASGSIKTVVKLNYNSANEGQDHTLLVSETQAAIIALS